MTYLPFSRSVSFSVSASLGPRRSLSLPLSFYPLSLFLNLNLSSVIGLLLQNLLSCILSVYNEKISSRMERKNESSVFVSRQFFSFVAHVIDSHTGQLTEEKEGQLVSPGRSSEFMMKVDFRGES